MVRRLTLFVILLVVAATGCDRQETHERYTPAPDLARRAVEAAMLAWADGRPVGTLDGVQPQTIVVDTHRRPQQTLEEFEVLGEVPAEAYRCFAVRVNFSNPEAEERLRYCVIGIDPLWVFRQEDYDMITHWDHKMSPPEGPDGQPKQPATSGEQVLQDQSEETPSPSIE